VVVLFGKIMAADIVQEIKLRTDLVELISAYVPLKRSGASYKGLCPFHGEKTPSFHVMPERGFYRCYGCGEGGDCFSFVQRQQGLSFNEAGEFLARRLGLEWQRRGDTAERRSERERLYDVNTLAERFFRRSLEQAPEVRQYLEKRGLHPETIEEFRIGYAPPGYEALLRWLKAQKVPIEDAQAADLLVQGEHGLRDRFVDRVVFPILDVEGRTIAFGGRTLRPDGIPKYLNSRETPIFQKGRTLYGLTFAWREIPKAGFAVAVEGYMDVIALHQAGIRNTVAGLGTAITDQQVGILRRYASDKEYRLVMCFDGDSAGLNAALRSSSMFEQAGCDVRIAVLPEGDDPDTYVKTNGADALRALLNRAQPLLDYQLEALRKKYDLRDEGARLPFVREAARTIAQSGSHLTRQEYAGKLSVLLDRLAEEWYPGDPHRAMQARAALTQEVARLLRVTRTGPRGLVLPGGSAGPPVPAPKAPRGARERAERYVLRAALSEDRWAERAAERLTPEQFATGELLGVANALLGNNGPIGSGGAVERAEAVRTDPALAHIASELLVEEAPLSEEGLEECFVALERARSEGRLRELQPLIETGEIGPGDPRFEEYRALRAQRGGRDRRED
jgi:DNA primase